MTAPLDLEALRERLQCFFGRHNFSCGPCDLDAHSSCQRCGRCQCGEQR